MSKLPAILSRLDADLDVIDVRVESRAEVLVDPLEVGRGGHVERRVVVERLLPIPRGAFVAGNQPEPGTPVVDYLYEPAPQDLLGHLIPNHVEVQIYRALPESAAAEHAARMTAMDAATRNSAEMIDQLTLYMNKVRQAAITREIIEVVSGAQAQ